MKNILLLNGENVQAVCMAHAFRKLGHCVTALCSTKMSSGYMTRYLNRKFKCPDLHLQSEAFSVFFHKHMANNRYDIIIPMGDESASFLSKHKNHIESQYSTICAIPEYDVFQVANDKHLLMELCEKNNICHPRTRTIQVSNIQEAIEYVGFPAMIKPNISAGAKGIVKVENANEVKKKLPNITHEFGECTLQQYIEQPDYYYNVMLYRNRNGKTVASTIIKIKRFFPLKGGSSCYSETIEQPYLIEQCEKCLDKLNWHGFADFDILEDKKAES